MPKSYLSDASSLLVRSLETFQAQRCLIVNGPGDSFPAQLKNMAAEVFCLNYLFDHHQAYQAQASVSDSIFSTELPESLGSFDSIILYWPKEKALAKLLIEQLSARLTSDGLLYCVGANNAGIKSFASLLKTMQLTAMKLDSARHCSLFSAALPATSSTSAVLLAASESHADIECKQGLLKLIGLPGVFCAGRLDEGTRLLLDNLPPRLGNKLLDFGCGCGVISAALAKLDPSYQVTAADINAYALKATEQTLIANGLEATTLAVTGIDSFQGQKFDAIITNPPFHQGVATDYAVTEQLISQAPNHLNRGGKLILVANRFLEYPPILQKAFGQIDVLASTTKFVVYQCTKTA